MNNLEKALSSFYESAEHITLLATILSYACETGKISYDKISEIAGDMADEVLLSANSWRLLLPMRFIKSGAWEDRLLLCQPGEIYLPPNIAHYLVQSASITGSWDAMTAITGVFADIKEPDRQKMPELVIHIGKCARDNQISGV